MNIRDALDHQWFVGANSDISKLRRIASNEGNEMLKFISYSNVDAKVAQEASKKSQGTVSPTGNVDVTSILKNLEEEEGKMAD